MRLDENKELFFDLIETTSIYFGIDSSQVEKDYFVTLFLKEIARTVPNIIFKGGTSLSKCIKIIYRFSEDIDLTLEQDFQTQGQKRKLKKEIVAACDKFKLELLNFEDIRSRRSYNCYNVSYPINYHSESVKPLLLIETTYITMSYPCEIRSVTSIIYDYLIETNNFEFIEKYELEPFSIRVQSLERTLIDKVFAICDYVISSRTQGNSRHIYDLHQLLTKVELTSNLKQLVNKVRDERKQNSTCYSAQDGVNINEILSSIKLSNIYKKDYNYITKAMMYRSLSYEEAISALDDIIKSNIFN